MMVLDMQTLVVNAVFLLLQNNTYNFKHIRNWCFIYTLRLCTHQRGSRRIQNNLFVLGKCFEIVMGLHLEYQRESVLTKCQFAEQWSSTGWKLKQSTKIRYTHSLYYMYQNITLHFIDNRLDSIDFEYAIKIWYFFYLFFIYLFIFVWVL